MTYFILRSGEDGTRIEAVTEEQLLKRITPDKDGHTDYGSDIKFLGKVPESDRGCWMGVPDAAILIIKGEIVIPKEKTIATKYELPK